MVAPVPAPTSSTRSDRSSGNPAIAVRTASATMRLTARVAGASRYRSAAPRSPPKSRSSGSARLRSTSASDSPQRRSNCCSTEAAGPGGISAIESGEAVTSQLPARLLPTRPTSSIIARSRSKSRRWSPVTFNVRRSASASKRSPGFASHPSSRNARSTWWWDSRSSSAKCVASASRSIPSASRVGVRRIDTGLDLVRCGKKTRRPKPRRRALPPRHLVQQAVHAGTQHRRPARPLQREPVDPRPSSSPVSAVEAEVGLEGLPAPAPSERVTQDRIRQALPAATGDPTRSAARCHRPRPVHGCPRARGSTRRGAPDARVAPAGPPRPAAAPRPPPRSVPTRA